MLGPDPEVTPSLPFGGSSLAEEAGPCLLWGDPEVCGELHEGSVSGVIYKQAERPGEVSQVWGGGWGPGGPGERGRTISNA